jgi:hypothetical protein
MKNKKGRPSKKQQNNPSFPGQYKSTVIAGTKKYHQINFRCPKEEIELMDKLADKLKMTRSHVLRYGLLLVQQDHPRQLPPDQVDMALVTRIVPATREFGHLLKAPPGAGLGPTLGQVLSDFAAIMRIEDLAVREPALQALREKINAIFEKAKALHVEKKANDPLTTTLQLV